MTQQSCGNIAPNVARSRLWEVAVLAAAIGSIIAAFNTAQTELNPSLLLAVIAASMVMGALGLRLPRGDVVRVDALAASAALALLPAQVGMVALFLGLLVGMIFARHMTRSSLWSVIVDANRHVVSLGAAYALQSALSVDSMPLVLSAGLAISVYVAVELGSLVVQAALSADSSLILEGSSMIRSVWQIYLGQACLGVALAVVYPAMGGWAIPVMTVLGAILLNGFAMYLRVKTAYQETIGALAKVSELHMAGRTGHAQEVANMSVAVGRRLGLGARKLEALNYAALLHEIGSLDRDAGASIAHDGVAEWAHKGAEILQAVPFLASAAAIVDCQQLGLDAERGSGSYGHDALLGGAIVRACCLADEARRADSNAGRQLSAVNLMAAIEDEGRWIPQEVIRVTADAFESLDTA
ncbi:MAG: hypothetical protein CVT66_02600 [Actinobacteria bacterium HGW-Actinobacteria-6]|nr:MAG: hypothetical protein CVT66_02600 [Actinobacteria bacterium HGW-Actinobacteria-6]